MPINDGQLLDGNTNYSLNVSSLGGLNIQVMFNSYGVDPAVADEEFLSLLDLLQSWGERDLGASLTAQKYTNVLYPAEPTIPDPAPEPAP